MHVACPTPKIERGSELVRVGILVRPWPKPSCNLRLGPVSEAERRRETQQIADLQRRLTREGQRVQVLDRHTSPSRPHTCLP